MPRLVCDQPVDAATDYVLFGLPDSPKEVQADPDPNYGFSLDLDYLPPGAYQVKARACVSVDGVKWCNLTYSDPFDFTVPERPQPPAGLRILF